MSYDLFLIRNGQAVEVEEKHHLRGGTYQVGGTHLLHINVTYNYGRILRQVLGTRGIRSLYGLTAEESVPILKESIHRLGTDVSDDYWKPTEGNVRRALEDMLELAQMAPPDAVWKGD